MWPTMSWMLSLASSPTEARLITSSIWKCPRGSAKSKQKFWGEIVTKREFVWLLENKMQLDWRSRPKRRSNWSSWGWNGLLRRKHAPSWHSKGRINLLRNRCAKKSYLPMESLKESWWNWFFLETKRKSNKAELYWQNSFPHGNTQRRNCGK